MTAKQNFEILLKSYGATPEHRFHPVRKWRFDFAFPSQMVAFEFEGGVFTQGRHSRGVGLSADCDKYNEAQRMGWKVYRFTAWHFANCRVKKTAEYIEKLIDKNK